MNLFYFNPRTREGCDDNDFDLATRMQAISIHAPVKGATIYAEDTIDEFILFQSTHP